jgi:hypothetical protein
MLPLLRALSLRCSIYLFHELPLEVRKRAIREMARVVKPGGLVVLTDSAQVGDREAYDKTLGNFSDFNEPYYVNYINTPLGPLFQVRMLAVVVVVCAGWEGGRGDAASVSWLAGALLCMRAALAVWKHLFSSPSGAAPPGTALPAGGWPRVRHEGEVAVQSWLLAYGCCVCHGCYVVSAVCVRPALTSCCSVLSPQLVGSSTKTLSFRKPLPDEVVTAAGDAASAAVAAAAEVVQEGKEDP